MSTNQNENPNAEKDAILLTLQQMVDLSIDAPEAGVVNFNLLHALLHVIVHLLQETSNMEVEIKGDLSDRFQNLRITKKPPPSLNLTEYTIGEDKQRKLKVRKGAGGQRKNSHDEVNKEKLVRTIERREDSKQEPIPNPEPLQVPSALAPQTVVVVEPISQASRAPHFTIAISKIEEEMEQLKEQVQTLTELPASLGLIDAARGGETPISDMFQILKLNKRMDASETVVGKMANVMEDLAKEQGSQEILDKTTKLRSSVDKGKMDATVAKVEEIEKRLDTLEKSRVTEGGDAALTPEQMNLDNLASLSPAQALQVIQNELQALKAGGLNELQEFQNKINDCSSNMNIVQGKVTEIEKAMEILNSRLQGGDSAVNEDSFMDLVEKFNSLQKDMAAMTEVTTQLEEDKEQRKLKMDTLTEQIDLLKLGKANREDLEGALVEKADACIINRKVSHDQFNTVCDEMNKGIEDAMTKLTEQKALWQQALDDIQKEIGNKLDKLEMNALSEFVHKKLKTLQEKFKKLSSMKEEQEAAGTKSLFLTNVNCISCDKNVVMKRELDNSLKPKPYTPMPPSKNIAPYLAYELDNLRKQQKCVPSGKNLNYFENALKYCKKKEQQKEEKEFSRYCGGSHTVTTPQQRVTRLGNFLEQWGPDVRPLEDEYIRGKDNRMYKASTELPKTSTPKPGRGNQKSKVEGEGEEGEGEE